MNSCLPLLAQKNTIFLCEFDNLDDFVELLAIPHLVSALIATDYDCSLENAFHLYWLSEPYGAMEFPSDMPCPALEELLEEQTVAHVEVDQGLRKMDIRLR